MVCTAPACKPRNGAVGAGTVVPRGCVEPHVSENPLRRGASCLRGPASTSGLPASSWPAASLACWMG